MTKKKKIKKYYYSDCMYENMSLNRILAFNKVRGAFEDKDCVCKAEIVEKFASADSFEDYSQTTKENKEMFDGEVYQNASQAKVSTPEKDQIAKWEQKVNIIKSDASKRIVIGAVYVPYDENDESTTVDTHGHASTAEEIEKAAYKFMEELNNNKIDLQHNYIEGYGCVVESYIAKSGDADFVEGTWVLGVKVTNDDTWNKIEKGEITGFSLAGEAHLMPPELATI